MHPERLTYIMHGQRCKCFLSWQELCYWKSFIEIYVLAELKAVCIVKFSKSQAGNSGMGFTWRCGVTRNTLPKNRVVSQPLIFINYALSVCLQKYRHDSLVLWLRAHGSISLNPSFLSAGWADNNDICFVELLEGLMELVQSQIYLLVILNIEEHFVGSEFFIAASFLAETERSINRFAEGFPLLKERRGFAHLAWKSRIICYLILGRSRNVYQCVSWRVKEGIIRDLGFWYLAQRQQCGQSLIVI